MSTTHTRTSALVCFTLPACEYLCTCIHLWPVFSLKGGFFSSTLPLRWDSCEQINLFQECWLCRRHGICLSFKNNPTCPQVNILRMMLILKTHVLYKAGGTNYTNLSVSTSTLLQTSQIKQISCCFCSFYCMYTCVFFYEYEPSVCLCVCFASVWAFGDF